MKKMEPHGLPSMCMATSRRSANGSHSSAGLHPWFLARRRIKIFLLVFILLLGSNYSLAEKSAYDREISFTREIFNFHVVAPQVTRGGQPSEAAFGLLKNYCGIKTILTFRYEKDHNKWEKEIVEKLGMKFINVPMDGSQAQSVETIEKCLDIINDKSNQPIFAHCYGGKDRTGLIFAAYRIRYNHWSLEDALMEMLVYGYDRAGYPNLERSLIKWNVWRVKK